MTAAVNAGLSVATLSKVQAMLRANGSLLVTTDEISMSLSISKRNERRILGRMEGAGIARVWDSGNRDARQATEILPG
jgi:response regulator of citrate/malate metabolism